MINFEILSYILMGIFVAVGFGGAAFAIIADMLEDIITKRC